jgi:hypothetical protein
MATRKRIRTISFDEFLNEWEISPSQSVMQLNTSLVPPTLNYDRLEHAISKTEALKTLIMGGYAHDGLFLMLCRALNSNEHLTCLMFNDCPIFLDTFKELCQTLKNNPTLTNLILSNTCITSEYLKPLCNALASDAILKKLLIARTEISSAHSWHIKTMLAHNTKMTHLSLVGCDVDDYVLLDIVDGLKENNTLRSLVLSNNTITDQGMVTLGKMVQEHHMLSHLDISDNRATFSAVVWFLKALENNESITHLKFLPKNTNAAFTAKLITPIIDMLKINNILHTLQDKMFEHLLTMPGRTTVSAMIYSALKSNYVKQQSLFNLLYKVTLDE